MFKVKLQIKQLFFVSLMFLIGLIVAPQLMGVQALENPDPDDYWVNKIHQGKDGVGSFKGIKEFIIEGDYLYAAGQSSESLNIINISDIDKPYQEGIVTSYSTRLTTENDIHTPQLITKDGDYVYVSSSQGLSSTFSIVDTADKKNPSLIGQFTRNDIVGNNTYFRNLLDMELYNDHVYLVSEYIGSINIVDVSDPANPSYVGAIVDGTDGINNIAGANNLILNDNYLFVSSKDDDAITVLDVTNPSNPTLVTEYLISDVASPTYNFDGFDDMYVEDDILYVLGHEQLSNGKNFLLMIDITNPLSPTKLGVVNDVGVGTVFSTGEHLYVKNSVAYITMFKGNDRGVLIVDVSDPANPVGLVEMNENLDNDWELWGGDKKNLFITEDYIFVVGGSHQINIYNNIDYPFVETVTSGGSVDSDRFEDVATDSNGNTIATGSFLSAATFGSNTLNSAGQADVAVVKHDSTGNVVWAQGFGSTGNDDGLGVFTDSSDNVYVTGNYSGSFTFAGNTVPYTAGSDIFLAKFDSNGNEVWLRTGTSTGSGSALDVVVDSSDNIYFTGKQSGTTTYESSATTTAVTGFGGNEIFVSKYNTSGDLQWIETAGWSGNQEGTSIAVDTNNEVYIGGKFVGQTRFTTATATLDITGTPSKQDMFIAKLDSNGKTVWAERAGSTQNDSLLSLDIDSSGNIYIGGYISATADFDSNQVTHTGDLDAFVAKYDNTGNNLWANGFGNTDEQQVLSLDVAANGEVYATGIFKGHMDVGNKTLSNNGSFDAFITKLDTNGNYVWAQRYGGIWADYGTGIAIVDQSNFSVGGYFRGNVSFDGITPTTYGLYDAFLLNMGE